MKTQRSIAEVLETLETQAAFHEERESFHAGQEEHHREQRSAHAEKLQEIRRRLEAFRAAAVEALDLAGEPAVSAAIAAVKEKADLGPASRPNLTRMIELILAAKPPGERFGPVTLCEEVNRHFADRLRRPFEPGQVSVALRRFSRLGRVRQVRQGRPHWEALYVREEPGS